MRGQAKACVVIALAMTGSVLCAAFADAGAAPPPPAEAQADTASVWAFADDNASISTAKLTDRFYTNGLRIGWTSAPGGLPEALSTVDRALWGDGKQRISFSLSQQIYTPADTQSRNTPAGDEPFAGILLANAALLTDKANSRTLVGVALGVVGPWALGREMQDTVHGLIGQGKNPGWHSQLPNEPAFEVVSAGVWRLPIGQFGGLETDALPALEVGAGTLRVYAQAGGVLRIGQGLQSDYGVSRVRPGVTGQDAFTPVRPFAWYVFAGVDGQAVAHDTTLDGSTFQSSPSVTLHPLVGEFQLGVAAMAYGVRLSYTHYVSTQTFEHQRGGLHQFGSMNLSARF